jgi:hypothetical protein
VKIAMWTKSTDAMNASSSKGAPTEDQAKFAAINYQAIRERIARKIPK